MSIIKILFRKICLILTRMTNRSIPAISDAKRYGNNKEMAVAYYLQRELPNCKIKQNILIYTNDGNAEIDCLVLYKSKLFAIEVKSWKGNLSGNDEGIVQNKTDRWTDEIHTKYHKSPFKQIQRAVHLLRKQIHGRVWVNPIVYFEDADSVVIRSAHAWASSMDDLVYYITTQGELSDGENAEKFFQKCMAADVLYTSSGYKMFRCRISDKSLRFRVNDRLVTRQDIVQIKIKHHWSYDTLYIQTRYGEELRLKLANGKIEIIDNGNHEVYAYSKLDWIYLG